MKVFAFWTEGDSLPPNESECPFEATECEERMCDAYVYAHLPNMGSTIMRLP